MACAGCGGGGGGRYNAPPIQSQSSAARSTMKARQGYAIVRYVGDHTSTRAYKGPSNTQYRFGNNPGHAIKYVLQEDVDHLLSLRDGGRSLFIVHDLEATIAQSMPSITPAPALVAVGAPQREHDHTEHQPQAIETPGVPLQAVGAPLEMGGAPPLNRPDGERLTRLPEGNQVNDLTQPAPITTEITDGKMPTVSELRKMLPGMSTEELAIAIAREKQGLDRATAVAILETALRERTPLE